MNSNNLLSVVTLVFVSISFCCSGQGVTLQLKDGPREVPIEDARKLALGIQKGVSVSNLIDTLGYPDEIRVRSRNEIVDGELRRWCYGVSEPGELPRIGVFFINKNLKVESVMVPARSWPIAAGDNRLAGAQSLKCLINSVVKTNPELPQFSYIADVSVTNCSATEIIEVGVEGSAGRPKELLHVEIYDHDKILASALCRNIMASSSGAEVFALKLMPRESKSEKIYIFSYGASVGLPHSGDYHLRVGVPLNRDSICWSELFPFTIE
jgi:hypothetical protein